MKHKVPNDPERLAFSENKTVAALQKWRHYAMSLIGLLTLREIEKRNLIIVPEDLFFDLLKKHDVGAFNIIYPDPPTNRDIMETNILVPIEFLKRVEFSLVAMKQYIDQAPPSTPLTWIADRKVPVTQLPDYKYAKEAIVEIKTRLSEGSI